MPFKDLVVVVVLIAVDFTLVRSDKQCQVVFLQHALGHVRSEVAAATAECVRSAAVLRHRITPQDVQHLRRQQSLSLCNNNDTSLSQLRLRPSAFSTHQLATSWLILEGGSPSILARLERPAIYFKGFLFWCSALMLFCCMTVCRPAGSTDWRSYPPLYCLVNFRLPWERSTKGKK